MGGALDGWIWDCCSRSSSSSSFFFLVPAAALNPRKQQIPHSMTRYRPVARVTPVRGQFEGRRRHRPLVASSADAMMARIDDEVAFAGPRTECHAPIFSLETRKPIYGPRLAWVLHLQYVYYIILT